MAAVRHQLDPTALQTDKRAVIGARVLLDAPPQNGGAAGPGPTASCASSSRCRPRGANAWWRATPTATSPRKPACTATACCWCSPLALGAYLLLTALRLRAVSLTVTKAHADLQEHAAALGRAEAELRLYATVFTNASGAC